MSSKSKTTALITTVGPMGSVQLVLMGLSASVTKGLHCRMVSARNPWWMPPVKASCVLAVAPALL